MANLDGFDAENVEPAGEFTAVPDGEYLAVVTETEMKDTKKKDGKFLSVKFQIIEGEYKGRNIWDNLNLTNPSKKAEEIAMAKLSSICRAVKILKPKDSAELHDLPLRIKVASEKYEGKDKNTIALVKSKDDVAEPEAATTTTAGPGAKPWEK